MKIVCQALQEMILQSKHSGITRDDMFYFMGTTNEGSFGIRGGRVQSKSRHDLIKSKIEEMAEMPFADVEKLSAAFEAGTKLADDREKERAVARAHEQAAAFIETHIEPWADKYALFAGKDKDALLKELEDSIAAEKLKPVPSFSAWMSEIYNR